MPKLKIGYNCINLDISRSYCSFRLATLRNKDITRVKEVVDYNLVTLGETIYWNKQHNFRLFRMTSDLIPFLSSPEMTPILPEVLQRDCVFNEIARIKETITSTNTKLSMHPHQVVVLNSLRSEVVQSALNTLETSARLLKMFGGNLILLHVGGAYGDKESGKKRLIHVVNNYVSDLAKSMLAFENDDKSYSSEDVVEVCTELNLPWVFDFHHEKINPSINILTQNLIRQRPPIKYHMCSGLNNQMVREHDFYVNKNYAREFFNFLDYCGIKEANVIFEAKGKNKAVTNIMRPLGNGYWELKD